MPQSIKSLFKTLISPEQHWKLNLLNNWATIIGAAGAHVHVEKISDDTVVLSVTDSCWMHELYLLSGLLLKKINQNLDQPRIKHLRFKQAGVRKKKSTIPNQKVTPIYKTVLLSPHEHNALTKIKDPHLSDALKQFLIRCYQEKS